jgi:hypothetical protein
MSNTTPVDYSTLAARRISPLRQRMIDDRTVCNFAPNTMLAYLKQVSYFTQHFDKSPGSIAVCVQRRKSDGEPGKSAWSPSSLALPASLRFRDFLSLSGKRDEQCKSQGPVDSHVC